MACKVRESVDETAASPRRRVAGHPVSSRGMAQATTETSHETIAQLTCACGRAAEAPRNCPQNRSSSYKIHKFGTGPPASEHGNGGLPKERTIACFFCAAPATLIAFHIIIAYPRYYFVHYLFVEGYFTDMTAQLLSTRACDI